MVLAMANAVHPVALVGAGPGDPELLTVKAVRLLGEADVVVYDKLVSAPVLALIPTGATKRLRRQGRPQPLHAAGGDQRSCWSAWRAAAAGSSG